MFISWNVLLKGCFAVFKVTVKVLNFNDCLPGQYLWLIKLSMVTHIISQSITQKYHFATFNVKATIVSTRSSEILKLLQSKLVWWYIITRQGKTLWKDFFAFTQGVRQRIWLGWLWIRYLPLIRKYCIIIKARVKLATFLVSSVTCETLTYDLTYY